MKNTLKSIGKILFTIFLVFYLAIEVLVTVCLLNFNDQRITEFGKDSWVIMDQDLSDEYKKGDLVIVTKGDGADVAPGDHIFFYNPSENFTVNYAEVNTASPSGIDSYTYKVGKDYTVYYDYYIGKDVKVYKHVGTVLSILESKWGFLLLIILPTMIGIIFEFYLIILEIIDLKKEA